MEDGAIDVADQTVAGKRIRGQIDDAHHQWTIKGELELAAA
jgi:hypothetical protein